MKIEFLLNKEGNFRGVIFNRQNEIQYSTDEIGYTQGGALTYQVNFNNLNDLITKLKRKINKSNKEGVEEKVKNMKKIKKDLNKIDDNSGD